MAGILRVQKQTNFTVMSNTHLNDENLSWKAKGVLSYLLSRPDDWKVYATDLQKRSTDGKTSTDSAIKELIEHGYIDRVPTKESDGKFSGYDYTVFENPQRITRNGKPDNGKPDNGKSDTTNNLYNQELIKLNTEELIITSEQSSDGSKYEDDSFEMLATNWLIQSILSEDKNARVPKTNDQKEKWCDVFEKIKRIDKRDEHQINMVLNFARQDSFWKGNILSPKKFREKFTALLTKMNNQKATKKPSVNNAIDEYLKGVNDENANIIID